MEVVAVAKNIRISPEKVMLVVAQIKRLPPTKAVKVLDFVSKSSSPILKKVIQSAMANAKHNFGLDQDTLVFKEILVGAGPSFRRYRAVARGRAHAIKKRTSHIKVVLEGEKTKEVSQESDDKSNIKNQISK